MQLKRLNLKQLIRAPLLLQICKIAAALAQTSLAEVFPAQGSLAKT
jgi:hypothetical protein